MEAPVTTAVRTTVHDPLELEILADGLGFPEGPCIRDDGSVLAVDIEHGTVVRAGDGAGAAAAVAATVVATPGGGPNGMALTSDGAAVVANNGEFLWTGLTVPA
jgi:gluconolactonase